MDRTIELALEGRWPVLTRAPADLAQRQGFVLKLHGELMDRGTWVLTQEQRETALYARADQRGVVERSSRAHAADIGNSTRSQRNSGSAMFSMSARYGGQNWSVVGYNRGDIVFEYSPLLAMWIVDGFEIEYASSDGTWTLMVEGLAFEG